MITSLIMEAAKRDVDDLLAEYNDVNAEQNDADIMLELGVGPRIANQFFADMQTRFANDSAGAIRYAFAVGVSGVSHAAAISMGHLTPGELLTEDPTEDMARMDILDYLQLTGVEIDEEASLDELANRFMEVALGETLMSLVGWIPEESEDTSTDGE